MNENPSDEIFFITNNTNRDLKVRLGPTMIGGQQFCIAQNASVGVKFSQGIRILDPWYLIGGTKWSRTKYRLKHPIIYSKRGLRNLWRKIKRIFIREKPSILCRIWKTKEEMLEHFPE